MNKLAKFLEKQAAQLVVPATSAAIAADLQDGNKEDKIISALSAAAGAGIADAYAQSRLIEKLLPKLQKLHDEGKLEMQIARKGFRTSTINPKDFIKATGKRSLKKLINLKGAAPVISLLSALTAGSLGGVAGTFIGKGINSLKDEL